MGMKLDTIADENKRKILHIIKIYDQGDGVTWSILKEKTGLAKATLSKHLKRLIDEGLIEVTIDKRDRRITRYKINENGLRIIRQDLAGFIIYVTLKNLLQLKLAELHEEFVKEKGEKDYITCVIGANQAEKLVKWLTELIGSISLEAMLMGGDYIQTFCKTLDLFGSAISLIVVSKNGDFEGFREFALERNKTLQETIGKLKVKDIDCLISVVKEILKKDLEFHNALLKLKERGCEELNKMGTDNKVKAKWIEWINTLIEISSKYFEMIQQFPGLASVYNSIKEELEKEKKGNKN
jgi:DNA-binding MarR family transcriptional regulator